VRKLLKAGELVVVSAADPLNLVGVLTPHPRVAAVYRNRVLLEDGVPMAALEAGELRRLVDSSHTDAHLKTLLARRSLRHPARPHLRSPTALEVALLARKKGHGEIEQRVASPTRH
jgi:ATP-dependent Lhr-like helicase